MENRLDLQTNFDQRRHSLADLIRNFKQARIEGVKKRVYKIMRKEKIYDHKQRKERA